MIDHTPLTLLPSILPLDLNPGKSYMDSLDWEVCVPLIIA